MIAALLARFGIAVGLKGLAWLGIAAGALVFAVWLSTKLYMAGVYAERIKTYEATIAQIKADLAANEEILKEAAIDASASEDREAKLKELIDALSKKPGTCPLTDSDVDGVSKIDASP